VSRIHLLTDAQFQNDGLVSLGIGFSKVVKQAPTLAYHHKKTAPGGMVLLVGLEMVSQLANPRTQDGDLDLRGTSVIVGSPVIGNQSGFFLSG
jgi:hypothetical protein